MQCFLYLGESVRIADGTQDTQFSVHKRLDPALQESQFCENGGGRSEKLSEPLDLTAQAAK